MKVQKMALIMQAEGIGRGVSLTPDVVVGTSTEGQVALFEQMLMISEENVLARLFGGDNGVGNPSIAGFICNISSRSLSLSRGLTLRRHVTTVHVVGKKERCLSLKRNFCLSVGSPNVFGVRVKPVKISAFKGSAQNNESGGRASGSKISKNSIKLSYIPKERSPAIHQLFKKWLTMLRTQSPSQVVREDLGEKLPAREKIPLLIFVPMYLAVNVIYGTGVSKELTPLWVFGPLIVALYVKMFQWLYALYVFSFKQTVKVVTNLPTYYLLAYNYIARGSS
ncbi:hypothetical protein LWI29_026542 [Acer saccharum]|uniref:Uncharacterized protein n=1 Tax=Acer saccharum TaxID=4024 RepID=A0AA39SAG1_ACESA|nr:hypothetical protein LWI29_026542 [Acer saccharum]